MNILYHVPLSPFCRKVRLSLAEKKIEVQLVEERYWVGDAGFFAPQSRRKSPSAQDGWGDLYGILRHL